MIEDNVIIPQLKYSSDKFLEFSTRNCAILGANGSGKSSLSRKILQLNNSGNKIQSISAQRNLTFKQGSLKGNQDDDLSYKSFSFNGPQNGKLDSRNLGHFFQENSYNNLMQDDFNENLEILSRDDKNAHSDASRNYKRGKFIRPKTKADDIFNIWNRVFINKEIAIIEGKIKVFFYKTKIDIINYEIENLSDGERSALYLITKCIYAPENGIIIVDEGETHLNPALLHELWDNIEGARQDCKFVYISHSIDFILSRNDCTKFWIKNFNHPGDWEIEKIENDNLPEDLILQIIGAKKEKILFVESKEDKDKLLYQKIYTDFKVVPVGTCENVINYTESLNKATQSYNKKYFGLIDRDFRNAKNLKSLEEKNIFHIPVAEFENIFFREEVIEFIFTHLGKQSEFIKKFKKLEKSVFSLKSNAKFKNDFYKNYIQEKFNQSLANFRLKSDFKFENNYIEADKLWGAIQNENDYNKFLELLNAKSIRGKIGDLDFSSWPSYKNQVLNIFNTEKAKEFRKIFLGFMPDLKFSK